MTQPTINRRQTLGGMAVLAGLATLAPMRTAMAQSSPDWRPLWNGYSLDGWAFMQDRVGTTDVNNVVSINDGVLEFLGAGHSAAQTSAGFLVTEAEHGDYHLRLDYRWGLDRWAPRAWQSRNSGVLYHVGPFREGKIFPQGIEFQMQEGSAGDAIMIDTLALHGPLLGGTPLWPGWIPGMPETYDEPTRAGGYARQWHQRYGDFERLEGWNTLDLVAFGDQSAHLVNGRIVNTLFHLHTTLADGSQMPLTRGRIALEFEWATVQFRNVMIRDLSAANIATIRQQGSY